MDWMEMRNDIPKVKNAVIEEFKKVYPSYKKRDNVFFVNPNGLEFEIYGFGSDWNFLVISYELSGEDGSSFYPEDYESFEDFVNDMKKEADEETN